MSAWAIRRSAWLFRSFSLPVMPASLKSTSSTVAAQSHRARLNGFTTDGKIPVKGLQDIYDQAFAAKLIPTQMPAAKVMDYSLTDEVLRVKK